MMDKFELEDLIKQQLTIREIAKIKQCSYTNIRYWLRKHDLKTKKGPKRKLAEDGTLKKTCPCGETDPDKFYGSKRFRCGKCHLKYTRERHRENRKFMIEHLGGECQRCRFKTGVAAFDVHHTDPSKKDLNWRRAGGWSKERIVKELQHCILLCRNCHALFHSGEIKLDEPDYLCE